MWNLSSWTKERTHAPGVEVWSLNHWTSREAPGETTVYHRYVM